MKPAPVILIAEDEMLLLKTLEIKFARAGFQVLSAANGTKALALLSEHCVDVVITDLHLPGASGAEVVAKAKACHGYKPYVLVSSGSEDELEKESLFAAGADEFLCKPYALNTVLQMVTDAVQQPVHS